MTLHLTDDNRAHEIAERIRTLIARKDAGDVTAAARRLARPIADVYQPERVLASGDEPATLDFLATVVHRYDADACWLLTGQRGGSGGTLPAEMRGSLVQLIGEVSNRILDDIRHEKRARRLDS